MNRTPAVALIARLHPSVGRGRLLLIRIVLAVLGLGAGAVQSAMVAPASATSAGQTTAGGEVNPGSAAVPAARQANDVAVITIKGEIDRWTSHSVKRRIEAAERGGASAIVFEIDTPGGQLGASLEICNMIRQSSITNTVAWVRHDAYSAGTFIALACREIVVSDHATMGDAIPIAIVPGLGLQQMQPAERQKMIAPVLAEIVDSARRRGYDEKLVQGFVTLGVELWMVEHVETGRKLFIDEHEYRTLFGADPPRGSARVVSTPLEKGDGQGGGAGVRRSPAPEEPAMETDVRPASPEFGRQVVDEVSKDMALRQLATTRPTLTRADRGDWRYVEYVTTGRTPLLLKAEEMERYGFATGRVNGDEELKQFFGAQRLVRMEATWSESLARFMTSLPVVGILIVVFLLALFIEMAAPGVGVPGMIAGAALVALVAPQFMVGAASWWGVAAIGAGLLLVALEIFVMPGFGIPGVMGVVLLFAGLVGVVVGAGTAYPGADGGQDLLWSVATVLMAFLTAAIGVYFVTKHYGALPVFNRLILTDEAGDDEQTGMLAAMAPVAEPGAVRVGDLGVATTPLRPAGMAEFGDRLVDVVSGAGFVASGARVRAIEVGRFRVVVEETSDGAGAGAPDATPEGELA